MSMYIYHIHKHIDRNVHIESTSVTTDFGCLRASYTHAFICDTILVLRHRRAFLYAYMYLRMCIHMVVKYLHVFMYTYMYLHITM